MAPHGISLAGLGLTQVSPAGLRERAALLPPKGKSPEISQAKEPPPVKTLWKVGAEIPAPKV